MNKTNFMFLRRLHGRIYDYVQEKRKKRYYKNLFHQKFIEPFLQTKKNKEKCVFLVLTPEHTNLGDHAIAMSEIELLLQNDIKHIEITGKQLKTMQKYKLLGMLNNHPILINGGGNMGTLWFDVEQLMRDIIHFNPKSLIVIMPNTFYYEDSDWGNAELQNSIKIYNSHKNLHIYAREKYSYESMKNLYHNVKLVPDMVLSKNKTIANNSREGCLVCLRSDKEKTLSKNIEIDLYKKLSKWFDNKIIITDTHSAHNIPTFEREDALNKKLQEFQNAELVITDRLHGMIFSAITGTPCIVLNSKSPKVLGCYEWINNLGYVKFCENLEDFEKIYFSLPKTGCNYHNSHLLDYYDKLGKDLKRYLN